MPPRKSATIVIEDQDQAARAGAERLLDVDRRLSLI